MLVSVRHNMLAMTQHNMLILEWHNKLVMARKMVRVYGDPERKTG